MMASARNPSTGELIYTTATAFSLMVFYAFAMQCMSTIAVVKRETRGWKWPMIQLGYMTCMAIIVGLIVYKSSDERRVVKECVGTCRSHGSPSNLKKKNK